MFHPRPAPRTEPCTASSAIGMAASNHSATRSSVGNGHMRFQSHVEGLMLVKNIGEKSIEPTTGDDRYQFSGQLKLPDQTDYQTPLEANYRHERLGLHA